MPALIPQRGLWPTVGHLVHTNALRLGCADSNISNYPPSILQ